MPPQSNLAAAASAGAPHQLCYLTGDEVAVNPLDMTLQCLIAKLTAGISPASLILTWADWALHLTLSPGKQMELANKLQQQASEWPGFMADSNTPSASDKNPMSADRRFAYPGWDNWPFNAMRHAFLQNQDFWKEATSAVRGVSAHHEKVSNFVARQLLDVYAPSNYPWLNPEVLATTANTGGKNLLAGMAHWMRDQGLHLTVPGDDKLAHTAEQQHFRPGREVALTPGKVVFRNDLIELIQYAPQTAEVYAEPVLIVPSWIMKYYILDLSPHNSMAAFLVQQGHTVFMISWKNPGKEERDLGMHDYLESGLLAALAEVLHITNKNAVHTVGYCLGGTLLTMAAAALAKKTTAGISPAQIKSISLLAAQTDFKEPGELGLFVDESQLAMLDALMWEQGYLTGEQMSGSFQLLNSRDLVWSKSMREYQLGIHRSPSDLSAWNSDTTRMPYRMHSEYMKHLFLHNDLAEGRYEVDGHAIALNDIHQPMYVVATERDHISPWCSVYKIHLLCKAPITFILASGGHNAGIISEPGHARRSYQHVPQDQREKTYSNPKEWLQIACTGQGSWWPHWHAWLAQHSDQKKIPARLLHNKPELGDAPGQYVLEK